MLLGWIHNALCFVLRTKSKGHMLAKQGSNAFHAWRAGEPDEPKVRGDDE